MTAAAFAVLAVVEIGFLAASNELYTLSSVTNPGEDVLFGTAFGQSDFGYKLRRAEVVKPDILVLGSSRANQFRAEMMPGARFYNAAGGAQSLEQGYRFVSSLYERFKPQLVLLTVDVWWFRQRPDKDSEKLSHEDYSDFSYRNLVANSIPYALDPKFVRSLAPGLSRSLDPIGKRHTVGYRASRYAEGYRPDGSNQYGKILLNKDPYYHLDGYSYREGFAYFKNVLRKNIGRFDGVGPINPDAFETLREFVELNRSNDVQTVLVLPPFAAEVYEYAHTLPVQGRYIDAVEADMARFGREFGVEVHDFQNLAKLGVPDSQTIDGIHADEFAYLTMTDRILHEGSALAKLVRVGAVDDLLTRMRNPGQRVNMHIIAR